MNSAGTAFEDWSTLLDHFGGKEEMQDAIAEAASFWDFPDVYVDDEADGVNVAMMAPGMATAPVEVLAFPFTEEALWAAVSELDHRATELLEVVALPAVTEDGDVNELIDALVAEFSAIEEQLLHSIGGGWISCDDLIPKSDQGPHKWFSVGVPLLAVIGIARTNSKVCSGILIPGGLGGPPRIEFTDCHDVETSDLLGEGAGDTAQILDQVITRSRRRFRMCRGCRDLTTETFYCLEGVQLCRSCAFVFTGLIVD